MNKQTIKQERRTQKTEQTNNQTREEDTKNEQTNNQTREEDTKK